MVGFMETLYNACDSLFSACQEGGICDTTMAGTHRQPHALMHPQFTALEGKMSEGDCITLKQGCNIKTQVLNWENWQKISLFFRF